MPDPIAVRCPSCSQEFPLSDAVMGSVRDGVAKELRADVERREKSLAEKLKAVADQQAALTKQATDQQDQIEAQVKQQVARVSEEIKAKAAKQAAEAQEVVMKDLRTELSDKADALRKAREQEGELRREKRQLEEAKEALAKQAAEQREQVEMQVKQQLAQASEEIKAKAAKQATEAQELAMKDLRTELSDKADALRKAQEQELELRREKRQLEEAKEALKLEVQRTLDEERGKLREQVRAAADEDNRLKIAEKQKVINDLMLKLEEAQRKAARGSPQVQGELLELDFEQQLRQAFPVDAVNEISKGVRGADVLQEVRNHAGRSCGFILYELKRTQNWSDGWVPKLKDDLRGAKAEVGVIVTEVLPKGMIRFGQQDGIFVCDIASAIPLAHTLRRMIQELAIARGHQEGAQEKMQLLYSYLTGVEFRQRVSAVIDAFNHMRADLERERRGMTRFWAKREKHILNVVENMAGMVGDMQAISGNALQDIPALEFEDDEVDEI